MTMSSFCSQCGAYWACEHVVSLERVLDESTSDEAVMLQFRAGLEAIRSVDAHLDVLGQEYLEAASSFMDQGRGR